MSLVEKEKRFYSSYLLQALGNSHSMVAISALGVACSWSVNDGDAWVGGVAQVVANHPGGLICVGYRSMTHSKPKGSLPRLGAVSLLTGIV